MGGRTHSAVPLRMRTHAYTNENLLAWKIFTIDIFVSIFKTHNVVGGVVYYINDIYGGRTSLFLTSQRMPAATDAYTCLYKRKFIGMENICLLYTSDAADDAPRL